MITNFAIKSAQLKKALIELSEKVLLANKTILLGLETKDYTQFDDAYASLENIDEMAQNLDNNVVVALALFHPEAHELRQLVSDLKITYEITRAASNTKAFLKNFPTQINYNLDCEAISQYVVPLQTSTLNTLEHAMRMIQMEERDEANELCNKANSEKVKSDEIYAIIEENIFKKISTYSDRSKEYFALLGSIKKLKKVADRAAHIATLMSYAEVGGSIH